MRENGDYGKGRNGKGKGKGGGRRGAVRRENGIVQSIKETFGFLRCSERQGDLFFSLSQAPREISVGDEVEFVVEERGGRASAVALVVLPMGTVVLDEIDTNQVCRGSVERELRAPKAKGGKPEGLVKPEGGEPLVFWPEDCLGGSGGRDMGKGAELEFRVCVEKASGRRRATLIKVTRTARQVKEAAELASAPREEGVVRAVKSDFGFIQSTTRIGQVFFRLADLSGDEPGDRWGSAGRIEPGQEVAFICLPDPHKAGKGKGGKGGGDSSLRAFKIELLPKGTIRFEIELGTALSGVVKKPPSNRNAGLLAYTAAGEAAGEVAFTAEGVEGQPSLRAGDEVSFDLAQHKATKQLLARQVNLVSMAPDSRGKREPGAVTVVNLLAGFGFIKCCLREADAYFRLVEVVGDAQHGLKAGTEVEFDLVEGGGRGAADHRVRAERVEVLEEGSIVWFESLLAEGITAEVAKPPSTRGPGALLVTGAPEVAVKSEFVDVYLKLAHLAEPVPLLAEAKAKAEANVTVSGLGPSHVAAYKAVASDLGLTLETRGGAPNQTVTVTASKAAEADRGQRDVKALRESRVPLELEHCLGVGDSDPGAGTGWQPLRGDLVTLDLCVDRRSLRRCARNVRFVSRPKERPPTAHGPSDGSTASKGAKDLGGGRSLVFTAPRAGVKSGTKVAYKEAIGPSAQGATGFEEGWRQRLRNTIRGGALNFEVEADAEAELEPKAQERPEKEADRTQRTT